MCNTDKSNLPFEERARTELCSLRDSCPVLRVHLGSMELSVKTTGVDQPPDLFDLLISGCLFAVLIQMVVNRANFRFLCGGICRTWQVGALTIKILSAECSVFIVLLQIKRR